MAVLLIAEATSADTFQRDSLACAVAAAWQLGEVHVLAFGSSEVCVEIATLDGVAQVLVADGPEYARGMAEPCAALLAQLASGYSHIVGLSGAFARNILPRLAALSDVMVITDVIKILGPKSYERPIYAGNAIQTVESQDGLQILTVRPTAFVPVIDGTRAPIEPVAVLAAEPVSHWLRDEVVSSGRPDLSTARIVVSGGRGVGSAENFALIGALADKLGGAVGASRAAVDSGFAANDLQVGQTGKVVAPDIYLAIGISGAIQHLAGMKDSKVIVAINKDEDAPIFQVADYGIVGDLFQIVPELTAKIA